MLSASGTGPAEMSNSPNLPGPICVPGSAVHVTEVTASLIVVLPSVTGVGSVVLVATAVQPGTSFTDRKANGCSAGRVTVTAVVPAVSDSVGTRKVSLIASSPAVASDGLTETCADAMPAPATRAMAVSETVLTTRRHLRTRGVVDIVILRGCREVGLVPWVRAPGGVGCQGPQRRAPQTVAGFIRTSRRGTTRRQGRSPHQRATHSVSGLAASPRGRETRPRAAAHAAREQTAH